MGIRFLKTFRLNWLRFSKELIINYNSKFLSKFWMTLFTKLEVKLFYNTAYHLQIDGSSKYKNKTVKIALRFFV